MTDIKLKVTLRSAKLNKANEVPAELYGPKSDNQHLVVGRNEMEKVLLQAGYSLLVSLEFPDHKIVKAIIREVQRGPLKNQMTHVDFMALDSTKPVIVEVGLEAVGKSNAITNMGGMLEKNLSRIKISCLSDHLIKDLQVDLAKLVDLRSVIRVEDIIVPEGIVIKNNPRDVIYSIAASRKQKAVEAKGEGAPAGAKDVVAKPDAKAAKPDAKDKKKK